LHIDDRVKAELFMTKICVWRIAGPCERIDLRGVLELLVLADAVEGIFNIKFRQNFFVVRWSMKNGLQLWRQKYARAWNVGSQSNFSRQMSIGATYSDGSQVSVTFVQSMELMSIDRCQ